MENGKLGSGPCFDLLTTLKPRHYYAAHLHCRFDALMHHNEEQSTKFVALDKCLPNRKFLDFLTIGDEDQVEDPAAPRQMPTLEYDLEWLTVLHLTNNLLNVSKSYTKLPLQPGPDDPQDNVQRHDFTPSPEEMETVKKKFNGDLTIPKNFTQTVRAYDPQRDGKNFRNLNERIIVELNPQTTEFCAKLGIDDPLFLAARFDNIELATSSVNLAKIDDQESTRSLPAIIRAPLASFLPQPKFGNDEEINLDELDDESEFASSEPKAVSDEGDQKNKTVDAVSPNDEFEEPALDLSTRANVKTADTLDESSESPSLPKKFKRRNQEIYARNDDDE